MRPHPSFLRSFLPSFLLCTTTSSLSVSLSFPSPRQKSAVAVADAVREGREERERERERERRDERKRDCGRRLLFFPLFLAIATYHSDQNLETRIVVRRFNSIYELGNLTNEWDAMWHVS